MYSATDGYFLPSVGRKSKPCRPGKASAFAPLADRPSDRSDKGANPTVVRREGVEIATDAMLNVVSPKSSNSAPLTDPRTGHLSRDTAYCFSHRDGPFSPNTANCLLRALVYSLRILLIGLFRALARSLRVLFLRLRRILLLWRRPILYLGRRVNCVCPR